MSGRVCPPQAVPFQARPFLPAQASATFSLELCLMSPSHQSSDNAWGALLGMDVSPWVALPNAHSKPPGPGGPWASRVPAQTEGSLEWEAAKLPGHPQPDPTPASPTALETLPNLTATSSSLLHPLHHFLQRGTPHPARPPPLRQREQQELRVWGRRDYVCRTESSLCAWNPD